MCLKIKIFQICLTIALVNKVFSLQRIGHQEQDELINHGLKQYIKRFEIINPTADEKFSAELKTLKEIFEYTLDTNNFDKKKHLLEKFQELLPVEFAAFLKQELAKQQLNENISIAKAYIVQMFTDLIDQGLESEALTLQYNLENIYRIRSFPEKRIMYNYIISNLSTDFQEILDSQPPHEVLLKAHLNFLLHFIIHVTLLTDAQEFEADLSLLGDLLYETLTNDNVEDKLQFLEKFNDVSTKFGRMLQQLLIEYKIDNYGN